MAQVVGRPTPRVEGEERSLVKHFIVRMWHCRKPCGVKFSGARFLTAASSELMVARPHRFPESNP